MKHALRVLAREKGFSCFAILILAFGIGAVTTIFSVVDGVLLKPLAYADPGRLYAVAEFAPQFAKQFPKLPVNAAHFRDWQTRCRACQNAALIQPASFNLTGDGEPERIDGVSCTWQLFHVLGVRPQLGRTFQESDDQDGNTRYVVITDSLWRRRLNADPNIIGKAIRLYGTPHEVIGVLPADFRFPSGDQFGSVMVFPSRAEIFRPLGINWAKQRQVGSFNYSEVVRLRPGASAASAKSEMTAALAEAGRLMKTDLQAVVTPLREQVTGSSRDALWLLLGAVCAVLLIVCVNLGNLMLVRAGGRLREAGIRRALGAGAAQLFRPMMMESLLIAIAGGALGVLLAYAGVQLLVTAAPIDIPRINEVRVNASTLAFSLCVSAICGLLCGDLVRDVPGEDHAEVRPVVREPLGRHDRDPDPREELPLLVRVPIADEADQVGPEVARIREDDALRCGAVGGDHRAGRRELRDEAVQLGAQPRNVAGELREARRVGDSPRGLLGDELLDGGGRLRSVSDGHSERAPVHRQPFDVANRQSMRLQQPHERRHGEVREVLVVDRVELEPVDEVAEVRHLDADATVCSGEDSQRADESVRIGNVREDVVRDDEVGLSAPGHDPSCEVHVEELRNRLDAARASDLGDVRCRFDPERRHAGAHEVPEQIAVVARGFDDEARLRERELGDRLLRKGLGVVEEGLRVRREVRVIPEQRLRRDGLGDLDERADRAADDVERKARIVAAAVRVGERVDERDLAEREHRLDVPAPARPAGEGAAHPRCARYHVTVRRSPSSKS